MKKITIVFLVFVFTNCKAQNLVNNWSFEDTVACPVGALSIDKAFGWNSYKLTPDYFNYCNSTQVGVPSNFMGFQYAKSGIAYSGFISYAKGAQNYREIIGTQLNQQLLVGQIYYISFYVNRAYNPAQFNNFNNLATNKIGLKFSTIPFPNFWTNPIAINDSAHIYSSAIISDTINWIKISGKFTADSSYEYLAIGNFFTDSLTSYLKFDSIASFAYYYVDDICVSTDSNYCNSLSGLSYIDYKNPFQIFPNPVSDEINIEGIGFTEIVIYNDLGKSVFTKKFEKVIYNTKLILPEMSSGIYLIKIKTINSYHALKLIHNSK